MDLQILNPPRPPIWRDPKRIAKTTPRNFVVGCISAACAAVSLVPPRGGYREPISLQIARGETLAWILFMLMGLAVLASVPTLVRARRFMSSLFCLAVVAGLWLLATTDPGSQSHLTVFIYLAGALLLWLWGLWASLQDARLLACAASASIGCLTCIVSFGVGERTMILGALAALNLLLLTDLLE